VRFQVITEASIRWAFAI